MVSVTGITAERALEIENASVVSGQVDDQGQLLLTTRGGEVINAGPIIAPTLAVEKAWPVGSVFISNSATNPSSLLGVGTWVRFASGRVLVGQSDTDVDFNTFAKTGGAKTVVLSGAESGVQAHTHTFSGNTGSSPIDISMNVGAATSNPDGGSSAVTRANATGSGPRLAGSSSHTHAFAGTTAVRGPINATEAHENMPPYAVAYFWVRTA